MLIFCNFWFLSFKQHSQTFCLLNSFDIKINGMQVNKQNIFNCNYLFWIVYCYALLNYSLFIKSRCSSLNQMLNQHRLCLKISYAVSGCNSFLVNSSLIILTFFQHASSFACHFLQWVFFVLNGSFPFRAGKSMTAGTDGRFNHLDIRILAVMSKNKYLMNNWQH